MSAIISDCGKFRYRLERQCPGDGTTAVIMVNPSTADAETNDATIRKVMGFGRRHRWGRIVVGNLFAFRATDIADLAKAEDPSGPELVDHLADILIKADRVIVAWGPTAKLPKHMRSQWRAVQALCSNYGKTMRCIGFPAKDGHPKHPLMLPYDSPILKWSAPCLQVTPD